MHADDQYDDKETECEFFVNTCRCGNNFFHSLDVMVGSLIVCDAFYLLTQIDSFIGFLLPLYFAVFGCLICIFVLYVPAIVNMLLPFYFMFIGRGIIFLLLGSVVLVFEDEFSVITGVITWIVAFTYILISLWTQWCTRYDFGFALPPPITQREDDYYAKKYAKDKGSNKKPREKIIGPIGNQSNNANHTESSSERDGDEHTMTKHELEKNLKYRMDLENEEIEPIDIDNDIENDNDNNQKTKGNKKQKYGVVAEEDDLL